MEVIVACFKVLSHNSLWGTVENRKYPQDDRLRNCRCSNQCYSYTKKPTIQMRRSVGKYATQMTASIRFQYYICGWCHVLSVVLTQGRSTVT